MRKFSKDFTQQCHQALEKARQGKNTTSCVAISERIIIGPLYLDSSLAAPENKRHHFPMSA